MKYAEAMIAWNDSKHEPVGHDMAPAGAIKVGPWPDRTNWSRPYDNTVGACMASVHEMTPELQALQLFLDFHTCVVMGGVDPQRAHDEFLQIDEYRAKISPDIRGADPE